MSKYINWYVVEIERRLQGRLPQDRVQELVREVEQHLESAKEELGDERKAIERFGPVAQIAENLVRGNRGSWRYSAIARRVAIALALLGALGFILCDILDQAFFVNWMPIGIGFLTLLTLACLLARRILIMEFSLIMVLSILTNALYFGSTRLDLGRIDGEDLLRTPAPARFAWPADPRPRYGPQTYEERVRFHQIAVAQSNSVIAQSTALLPKVIIIGVLQFSLASIANLIGYALAMIVWRATKMRRKLLQS